MKRRYALWLICGCGLLAASCGRGTDNLQVAKPVAADEKLAPAAKLAEPLVVDSYREVDLRKGCQLHMWNIRAHGLKKFTTSLLVIRDGKAETAGKIEYTWGNWDNAQAPAAGQILLLMQDGQIFGVKDKRLPLLTVDFPKLQSHGRMTSTSNTTIDGVLNSIGAMFTKGASPLSFPPGKTPKAVLYAEMFVPAQDHESRSLYSDLDLLMKQARSGRVVVAVSVEGIVH